MPCLAGTGWMGMMLVIVVVALLLECSAGDARLQGRGRLVSPVGVAVVGVVGAADGSSCGTSGGGSFGPHPDQDQDNDHDGKGQDAADDPGGHVDFGPLFQSGGVQAPPG